MNILICYFNLFKPKNWLILMSIILNIFLCFLIVYFILCLFPYNFNPWYLLLGITALYLIVETFMLSPIGEVILRKEIKMKPMQKTPKFDFYDIFDIVDNKAKSKTWHISKHIKFFYTDSMSPNAFALGSRTICITKGLLEFPIEQIEGFLAHEFGHIRYYDSYISMMALHGNILFKVVLRTAELLFLIGARVLDFILSVIINIISKSNTTYVSHFFNNFIILLTNWLFYIVSLITTLLFMARSKLVEYRADKYAYEIGFGINLVVGLEILNTLEIKKPKTLGEIILSSHPNIDKRINRLNKLIG